MSRNRAVVLAFLFLAALGHSAVGQTVSWSWAGWYRATTTQTGTTALVRLDLVNVNGGPWVVAALLDPQTGYRAYAGLLTPGGLHIPFVNLQQAKDPFQLLGDPVSALLQGGGDVLIPGSFCQIEFIVLPLNYSCGPIGGPGISGTLVKLRD